MATSDWKPSAFATTAAAPFAAAAAAPPAPSTSAPPAVGLRGYQLLTPHTAMTLLRRSVALLEALTAFPLNLGAVLRGGGVPPGVPGPRVPLPPPGASPDPAQGPVAAAGGDQAATKGAGARSVSASAAASVSASVSASAAAARSLAAACPTMEHLRNAVASTGRAASAVSGLLTHLCFRVNPALPPPLGPGERCTFCSSGT